jgi:predicted TPR repeat methyltransferase
MKSDVIAARNSTLKLPMLLSASKIGNWDSDLRRASSRVIRMDNKFQSESIPAASIIHPWEDFESVLRHASQARQGGDIIRAHAFFARATELKPEDAQGWVGWASTAQELDEAITGWGHALAITPLDLRARDSLHDVIVNKIEMDGRERTDSFLVLGRRLAQMGLRHFAHQLLVRATELMPRSEEAWLWRGGTTDDSGETTMCLRRVLEINPENVQARAGLRWTAPKTVVDGLVVALDDIATIMEEGQRAFSVGDQKRAYESFSRATELAPNDAQAWFWRGTIAPDTEEAIRCMDQVLRINPNDTAAIESRWYLRIRNLRAKGSRNVASKTVAQSVAPVPSKEIDELPKPQMDSVQSPPRLVPLFPVLVINSILILIVIILTVLLLAMWFKWF